MAEYKNISDSDLAQIRNIIDDNPLIALDILHDCAELIGAISVSEYSHILGVPKRTVQDRCKKDNITCVEIGNVKFPCINID
jgi:hypothetical protein